MTLSLPFHNERFNRIYSTVHNNFWPCRNRAPLLLLTVIAISLFLCTFYLNSKIVHTSVSSTTSRYSLTERLAPDEPLYNHTHAYITSAYYYENSKSLGKNAVAMVIVMSQRTTPDLEKLELTVVGKRGNQTSRSLAQIKKEAPEETSCEYIMTSVQTVTLDNPETLEIEAGGVTVPVPFKRPRTWAHSPVIMCISPQFVAEKWQVFLMNIHVIRRYGGHLHVYITSIVEELFNTLKVYESWGSLTLDYWVRMKFAETKTSHKNPMKNVEWRNQAGAQTDCLLQYKEVADFVAFFDIDDILIPRLSHNYHQEFSSHFDAFPSYHSIFYQKRDVAVQKVLNASDFSFRHLFSTMEIRNETGYGKSIVDPLKYNSTWIHHSVQLPENKIYKVPNTELIHVKDVLEEEMDRASPFRLPKMFGTLTDPMIRETDLQSLDNDFQSAFADATFNSTSVKMVDHNYYAPIVFQCYNESFYHPYFVEKKGFEELCPNADSCVLPQRADIKCIHSDAEYISGPEMYPITFHYAVNPFWSREIGCFQ